MCTLTVNQAPAITGPTNQTTCTGINASLTVTVSGTNTYQWYSGATGSGTAITGASTASYSTSMAGSYYCVVTSSSGCSAPSATATVTVISPPTITGPTNQTTCSGTNATLTVTASGTNTYQWYSGTPNTGTAIPSVTSASYATATAGSYYCVVTGSSGCSATSAAATVTVNTPPAITGPTNQTTCSGTNATLTVTASGTNTYQWYSGTPPNGTLLNGAISSSYSPNTAGSYYCKVTGNGCTATSSAAIVTVNSPTISNPSATGICSGSGGATMTVTASSGAVLQWYRGTPTGTHTALTANTYYSGVAAATLTFNNGNSTMQDYYYCVATSSGCSATSGTAYLTVYNPPTITKQPTDQTVCSGSSGTFTITASSGATGYQWYQEGSQGSSILLPGATSTSYTTSTSGYYWCNVSYGSGCAPVSSSHANLWVNAPLISTNPSNTSVCGETNGGASMTVSGPSATSFQWYDANGPISDSKNYSGTQSGTLNFLYIPSSWNGTSYHCVVTGSGCTATSSSATLTVYPAVTNDYITNSSWLGQQGVGGDPNSDFWVELNPPPGTTEYITITNTNESRFNGTFSYGGQKYPEVSSALYGTYIPSGTVTVEYWTVDNTTGCSSSHNFWTNPAWGSHH